MLRSLRFLLAILAFLALVGTLLATAEFLVVSLDVAPTIQAVVRKSEREDQAMARGDALLIKDDRLLWRLRPGAVIAGDTVNAEHHRGTPARGPRSRHRIVVLGDAVTLGVGVEEKDTWPRQLARLLAKNGYQGEVLNLAVDGYTIEQGVLQYESQGRSLHPDVVVAAFGVVQEVMTPPGGLSDNDRIAAVAAGSSAVTRFLERYALWRWIEGRSPPPTVSYRVPPDRFRERIGALQQAVKQDGAELVLVSPPRRVEADQRLTSTPLFTRILGEEARRLSIPMADAMAALRGSTLEGGEDLLFRSDLEPTAEGFRLYALAVAVVLHERGLLP